MEAVRVWWLRVGDEVVVVVFLEDVMRDVVVLRRARMYCIDEARHGDRDM